MPSCFGSRRRPYISNWSWKKTSKQFQFQFLSLPREIRDIIYDFVLPSGKVGRDETRDAISIDRCWHQGFESGLPYITERRKASEDCTTKATAILYTCRQVHWEATNVLCKTWSFRYDPPYIESTLLEPYDIYSDHQRAGSSSTRLAVTHLPYSTTSLSTLARFEHMEVFSAMAYGSWVHPLYDPTVVLALLAKYATSLKFLLVRLDDIASLMDCFDPFAYLIARLPHLLNSIAQLKTIDIHADIAGETGRSAMPVLGRCAEATAELGTWALEDLSSIEVDNERTARRRQTELNYKGRWLLTK